MYSTCLSCTRNLGANDVLETLPIGRRIAFDGGQGRLWVVCGSCGKWNLVPFDNRLESIDACERLFSDTPTRFSTDNIGLAKVREGLELVRIGAPQRPEFASWRYGAEYRRRRIRALATSGVGIAVGGSAYIGLRVLAFGGNGMGAHFGGLWGAFMSVCTLSQGAQWSSAYIHNRRMRLKTIDPSDGKPLTLRKTGLMGAKVVPWDDGLALEVSVSYWSASSFRLVGEPAEALLRRILGRINMLSGSKRQLTNAVDRVPTLLGSDRVSLLQGVYDAGVAQKQRKTEKYVRVLPASDRLALEMLANESDERRWLTGELALLERQWQEAEALAKIADSLAVPDDVERDPRLSS